MIELAYEDMELIENPESRTRRYLKVTLVVFAAWSAIGVMNAFQRFANTADMRPQYPLWTLTKIALMSQWLKAVLSLPLLWFVANFPVTASTWKRQIPRYVMALVVYILAYIAVRPFVVPNLYFSTATMLPMEYSPPFTEIMWVSFRSFFGDLLYSFCLTVVAAYAWEYAKHIKREQLMQERLQARLARAELHALKMQLQPHFLFNTLHTISNLASVDSTKAQRMIARLSELLRLSLDHVTSEAVPVRRELDFLKTYLDIEQTRFEERLRVTIDFEEEVLDAELPNMLLQPLVENAIKHGISKRAQGGSILLVGRREQNRLVIVLSDDGAGSSNGTRGSGIGISNTRARLQQTYGGDFAFEVRPTERGMVIKIDIPFSIHSAVMQEATA
jgi:two-component system, LytTR family, sensor kinase